MFPFNALRGMRPRAVHSRGGSRHPHSRRSGDRPLALEALEDRCLPSSYSFTLLADDGPDSPFAFPACPGGPSLNDQGTAAFNADLKSGGAGKFTRDMQGNLGIIAVTSDLVSAFLGGGITSAGTVSFLADLRAGGQAVFTGSGGPLSRIADTTSPDSPFSSIGPRAANINNEGTVSFRATLTSGGTGIFTERAGQLPSILYVTGGRFADLLGQVIQRNGNEVAFGATLSTGETGVFVGDGLTTTTIATTGDTYSALAAGTANDAGAVAFLATLTAGGQAIVTGDGTRLTTLADTGGPFSSFFGNTAVNNDGRVAFSANLAAGGSGIFTARDGAVDEVIGTGDALFGSTVTSFATNPFAPPGFNDLGQLSFGANLADGRAVLVRADPDGGGDAPPGRAGRLDAFLGLRGQGLWSLSVGTTPGRPTTGVPTSADPNLRRADTSRSLPLAHLTATPGPAPVQAAELWSAVVPFSSAARRGAVQQGVFADFQGDWVTDTVGTSRGLVG
jgi:hypothetical protein